MTTSMACSAGGVTAGYPDLWKAMRPWAREALTAIRRRSAKRGS